jgi:hypothetical protein
MQQVHDKVSFTLSYIGNPAANDGVDCKHGPSECLGNIIELCAREIYPDPKLSLGFTMCLTKDYRHIPERALIEDCALEHALDFKALNECATRDDGGHGMALLRDSVQRTIDVGTNRVQVTAMGVANLVRTGKCHEELHNSAQQRNILHP